MTALFLKLLNMSIPAGWLVLAVLVLRLVLKKAPKWTHCVLWGLVALRLVCPVTIESSLSLIPDAQPIPEAVLSIPAEEIPAGFEDYTMDTTAFLYRTVPGEDGTVSIQISDAETTSLDILTVVCSVWLLGVIAIVLYAFVTYRRLHDKVQASIRVKDDLFICDYIDSPFILGVRKPIIYLPSALHPEDAAYVLAHERSHLKRKDHWWKPLGFTLLALYWFHPLIWVAYILLCRDIELACDERVVKDLGRRQKKEYSEALLSCSIPRHMIAACPLAFGEVGVKERVKNVLRYRKPSFWVLVITLVAILIVSVCFLTNPKTEEAETSADIGWDTTVLTDVATLSEQAKPLITQDLDTKYVTFFDPYVFMDTLIVGCEYDGKYGAAWFEKFPDGQYRLRQVLPEEDLLETGYDDVGLADFGEEFVLNIKPFVCKNVLLTHMAVIGNDVKMIEIGDHPSLMIVEAFRWDEDEDLTFEFYTRDQYEGIDTEYGYHTTTHIGSSSKTWQLPGNVQLATAAIHTTATGLTMKFDTFRENGDSNVSIHPGYCLERWNGSEYVLYSSVPAPSGTPNTALGAGGSLEFVISWDDVLGSLPAGNYRIGKTVSITPDYQKTGDTMVYAKFCIHNDDFYEYVQTCRTALESLLTRYSYHVSIKDHSYSEGHSYEDIYKHGFQYLNDRIYVAPDGTTSSGGTMEKDGTIYSLKWQDGDSTAGVSSWSCNTYLDHMYKNWSHYVQFGNSDISSAWQDGDTIHLTVTIASEDYYDLEYIFHEDGTLSKIMVYSLWDDRQLLQHITVHDTTAEEIKSLLDKQDVSLPMSFSYEDDLSLYPDARTSNFRNTRVSFIDSPMIAVQLADQELQLSKDQDYNIWTVFYDESTDIWKVEYRMSSRDNTLYIVYLNAQGITQRIFTRI